VLQALRRLLLQGALRVVLVAVTTVCVMGFLSLVAATSQVPVPALADAMAQSRACMPSQRRAKAETPSPKLIGERGALRPRARSSSRSRGAEVTAKTGAARLDLRL
jgi:hypothetical protein